MDQEFETFEHVLGRDRTDETWLPDIFLYKTQNDAFPYRCANMSYKYCIPYKGNESLKFTTKDSVFAWGEKVFVRYSSSSDWTVGLFIGQDADGTYKVYVQGIDSPMNVSECLPIDTKDLPV